MNCSFCGKHQDDVVIMIRHLDVCICDECVKICNYEVRLDYVKLFKLAYWHMWE